MEDSGNKIKGMSNAFSGNQVNPGSNLFSPVITEFYKS